MGNLLLSEVCSHLFGDYLLFDIAGSMGLGVGMRFGVKIVGEFFEREYLCFFA